MSQLTDAYHTGSTAPQPPERSLERALGTQIRAIRRRQDLSVAELASAAGISNGTNPPAVSRSIKREERLSKICGLR